MNIRFPRCFSARRYPLSLCIDGLCDDAPQPVRTKWTLQIRLVFRFLVAVFLMAAMLFLPAGSLRFWQAWVYLALFLGSSLFRTLYFYRRDPRLLERRLQMKETALEQRLFKLLWRPLFVCALLLPGFDYRFGWSRSYIGAVPLWLIWTSQTLVCWSYLLVFQVLRVNSFASGTVQVETGQRVISTGPYAFVRHPMYSGFIVAVLFTPLALGSYVALPVFALLVPALVYRLVHEEKLLREQLAGYADYCRHTRFRLVPFVL
jgi:protein-S-isoprenylcysteine O-methyltransferase Ste14